MKRVAILLSGRGSNFLALSDAIEKGDIPAEIVLVISNRDEAPGLEKARKRGYNALFIPSKGKKRGPPRYFLLSPCPILSWKGKVFLKWLWCDAAAE